jgi:hypothetical protein
MWVLSVETNDGSERAGLDEVTDFSGILEDYVMNLSDRCSQGSGHMTLNRFQPRFVEKTPQG